MNDVPPVIDSVAGAKARPGALAGLKVIELGRLFAAPFAAQTLADMGADVIKVESPEGDSTRQAGAKLRDPLGGDTGDRSSFVSFNRNKRSVVADLTTEEGVEFVRRLAAGADVFIENFKVGDLERRGLGYEALRAINPGLVYLSVTGFGQTGPYRSQPATDPTIQAMSGFVHLATGQRDEPVTSPVFIMDFAAGMFGTTAVLAALRHRDQTGGEGQHIDISLLDAGVALMTNKLQQNLLQGDGTEQEVSVARFVPTGLFEASDARFQIAVGDDRQFERFCRAADLPALLDDPRYRTRQDRIANRAPLTEVCAARFRERSVADWMTTFGATGVMFAPLYSFDQMRDDPQVRARQLVVEVAHPTAGVVPLIRSPIRMSGTPVETYARPPKLGEHTAEVLDELGYHPRPGGEPTD